MRKWRKWKKWVVGITAFAIAASIAAFIFIDRELSKMYGGHTEDADFSLPDNAPSHIALTNVQVLTPSADSFVSGLTVLVKEGTIVSVGANLEVADETRKIDGKGMYLVPGYTDSHVHLWESKNDLLLYIANGVTQIREMNGLPAHLRWKKEIAAGRLGPDMFVTAPQFATFGFFEGLFVGWTQHKEIVRSEKHVIQAVESYVEKGYDAVKASSFLDKKSYIALSKATRDNAIPLVGHVPLAADLGDLWRSNQTEVAHVEELMKALRDEFGGYNDENANEFLEFVRNRSGDVAGQLIENDIAVTSTISLIDSLHRQKSDLDALLASAELQYTNPGISEGTVITSRGMGWLPDVNIYRWPADWDEGRRAKSLVYWKTYSQAQHIVFDALLAAGVKIMAGTDSNVPVMVPGFSLHEEMKALNQAGMSPAQVLASTTTAPARFMKMNTGEIRPGFKANLVLLRENPLQDVDATDSIEMVIVNGRALLRSDLDTMLLKVKAANDNSRSVPIANR